MINEIILGKKYKVANAKYTRTPLFVHNNHVFYEYEWTGGIHYHCCLIDEFKKSVEEIPEAPEEWFEVFFRVKGGNPHPTLASQLYSSKEDFLSAYEKIEEDFDLIKLRKVEL